MTPDTKRRLATLSTLDLVTGDIVSPLAVHVQRFVHSAVSFETGAASLALPAGVGPGEGARDDAPGT